MTAPTIEEVLARTYTFIVKADPEEGGWVVFFPDLPARCRHAGGDEG